MNRILFMLGIVDIFLFPGLSICFWDKIKESEYAGVVFILGVLSEFGLLLAGAAL